jgi:hypothetical protein
MNSLGVRYALAGYRKSRIRHAGHVVPRLGLATMLLALGTVAVSGKKREETQFKYAGGTEQIEKGCEGNLELSSQALTFRCASGSISAPYTSISLMQYRSDISQRVLKMNLG